MWSERARKEMRVQTCAILGPRREREIDRAFSISPLPEGDIKSEVSHLFLSFKILYVQCSVRKVQCMEHKKEHEQKSRGYHYTFNFALPYLALDKHCTACTGCHI